MLSDSGNCCRGAFCVLHIRKFPALTELRKFPAEQLFGHVFQNQYNLKK